MEGKKSEGSVWLKNAVLWTLQDLAWSAVVLFLWKHLCWPWDIPFAVCVPAFLVHLVARWVCLRDFLLGSDEGISGKVLRRVSRPVRLLAPVLGMLLFCGFLEPPRAHVPMAGSLGNDFLWVLELVLSSLATLLLLLGNVIGSLAFGPIPPSRPVPVDVPKDPAAMTQEEFLWRVNHPPKSSLPYVILLLVWFGFMLRDTPVKLEDSRATRTLHSNLFDAVVVTILLLGFQAFAVLTLHLPRKKWRQGFDSRPDENAPPASGSGKKRRRKR